MDFSDGSTATTEYSWDKNSNMTRDLNRKISKIGYNSLNLPETITSSEQDKAAREAAEKELAKDYCVVGQNCAVMVQEALSAAGKDPGYISAKTHTKYAETQIISNLIPKIIFYNIIHINSGKIVKP